MTDPPKPLLAQLSEARRIAQELAARPAASGSPQVIAICNQKGGCGKTTTAINLAAELGMKGYPTLLIDLDPQAHASLGLGVDVESLTRTVYHLFQEPHGRLDEIIVPTNVPNLSLAPADWLLAGAQLELATVLGREQVLRQAVKHVPPRFRYLILDCSPSLNLVTINALTAADFCLVPLQPHYYALEGMKALFTTIELIQERFNPALRLLGIVVVLVDARAQVVREMIEQIRGYFQGQVFKTAIRLSTKLIESSIIGQPVSRYAPRSTGALDYARLTEEVLARLHHQTLDPVTEHGTPARTSG